MKEERQEAQGPRPVCASAHETDSKVTRKAIIPGGSALTCCPSAQPCLHTVAPPFRGINTTNASVVSGGESPGQEPPAASTS